MAEGVLPPAIQEFIADATKWVAGIDEMVAANDRLIASIEEVNAASKEAALGGAAAGAEGAAGAAAGESAAGADAVKTADREAAEAADVFAEAETRVAQASATVTDAMAVEAKAIKLNRDAEVALADTSEKTAAKTEATGTAATKAGGKFKLMGLAALAGGAIAVKMAGDFQQSMTRLVTSAGESEKNLAMVGKGILKLSVDTNTSTKQLAQGMYYVESAGYHGAAGLNVLKAAAQGAQAEGADLATVSNALTSALNAYHLPASAATAITNQMVTAVGRGKMTMQDFSAALAQVLPVAAAAHLRFAQVAGALSTMTAQGMSADQAAQNLRHVIMALQNPSHVQIQEMQQLGINSNQLAKNLGRTGLTGTIEQLETTIMKQMGKGGMVLLKSFNESKLAARSAVQEIKAMPPSIQKLAKSYLDGSMSVKEWNAVMFKGDIPAKYKNLLQQFSSTANAAHGFNNQLKAGGGNAQTFTAALSKVTGGMVGTQVALMVGGAHAATFAGNVKAIGAAARNAGSDVQGWGEIQKNFNFQLGQAEQGVKAMAISFGQALLPAVTPVIHALATGAQWLARNSAASKTLAIVIGTVLAVAFERKLVKGISAAGDALRNVRSDVSNVIGFFRKGEADVSGFGRAMQALGSVGKGAWSMLKSAFSGLAGLFVKATVATEAQTVAQDAQSASAAATAASSEAVAVASGEQAVAQEAATAATEAETVAQEGLDVAMTANPIGIIIVAIAALVAAIVLIATKTHWFQTAWTYSWHAIKAAALAVWHFLVSVFHGIAALIGIQVSHYRMFASQVAHAWTNIKHWAADAWHFLVAVFHGIMAGLAILTGGFGNAASGIGQAWDNIKQWASDAWNFIVRIFNDITQGAGRLASDVISAFAHWVSGVATWLGHALSDVGHWASSIVSTILNIGGALFSAGVHIIESLAHGIASAVGAVISAIGGIAKTILSHLPFSPAKMGPLSGRGDPTNSGREIMRRLAAGMTAEGDLPAKALTQSLGRLTANGPNGRLSLNGAFGPVTATAAQQTSIKVDVDLQNTSSSAQWQLGLQRTIQEAVLDYSLRNSGNGLVLPQRGR